MSFYTQLNSCFQWPLIIHYHIMKTFFYLLFIWILSFHEISSFPIQHGKYLISNIKCHILTYYKHSPFWTLMDFMFKTFKHICFSLFFVNLKPSCKQWIWSWISNINKNALDCTQNLSWYSTCKQIILALHDSRSVQSFVVSNIYNKNVIPMFSRILPLSHFIEGIT